MSISTDDFRTGGSSLSCLKCFPIDCLTIDRTFVRDGQVTGTIRSGATMYRVRPLGGGLHVLIEVDESRFPPDEPAGADLRGAAVGVLALAGAKNTPVAYGHGFRSGSSWRTIMAYDCTPGCPRLQWWSNPNVTRGGVPMGTTGTHDNARVLREPTALSAALSRRGEAGNP